MNLPTQDDVITFWFGHESDDARVASAQGKIWWSKDSKIDALICSRFEALVEAAASSELNSWGQTPTGELARIIVLDQFPRNIYRGSARAFAYDAKALQLSLTALENKSDLQLRPVERIFLYLPLEHSEILTHQERSVELFSELVDHVPPEQRKTFQGFLDYALRHRDIIARFGRFPHRNAVLGRISTDEEKDFLTRPGSSF